jgi:hypothetical protein
MHALITLFCVKFSASSNICLHRCRNLLRNFVPLPTPRYSLSFFICALAAVYYFWILLILLPFWPRRGSLLIADVVTWRIPKFFIAFDVCFIFWVKCQYIIRPYFLLFLMFLSAHLKDVARRAKHQFRSGLSKALPKKAWSTRIRVLPLSASLYTSLDGKKCSKLLWKVPLLFSLCWSYLLFIANVLFASLHTMERIWWTRDGNPPNQKNLPSMRICCPPSMWNRETGKWYVIHESSASGEATGWCKDDPACQLKRA